jgi:hypothetical protein
MKQHCYALPINLHACWDSNQQSVAIKSGAMPKRRAVIKEEVINSVSQA